MGYKNLIDAMRGDSIGIIIARSHDAADAIETLLAERDAAIDDLLAFRTCSTCAHSETNSGSECEVRENCLGEHLEWRGVDGK